MATVSTCDVKNCGCIINELTRKPSKEQLDLATRILGVKVKDLCAKHVTAAETLEKAYNTFVGPAPEPKKRAPRTAAPKDAAASNTPAASTAAPASTAPKAANAHTHANGPAA